MKFSIKYFFRKCDQIRNFLQIWSYLLKKFSMENFIFLFSAEYDLLAKTDSPLLGDFIFMLNPDWIAK